MSIFLCISITFSIFCAMFQGAASLLSGALFEGAQQGVRVTITLAGPLCLWCGLTYILNETALSDRLSRLLAPALKRLFPHAWTDPITRRSLCGNLSANLLGLGNAATPLGIRATCRMAEHCHGRADDELCKLIILNTASVQLLPTTVAALRAGLGAAAPFDILPAVWITSACSVFAGLAAGKLLSKCFP